MINNRLIQIAIIVLGVIIINSVSRATPSDSLKIVFIVNDSDASQVDNVQQNIHLIMDHLNRQ